MLLGNQLTSTVVRLAATPLERGFAGGTLCALGLRVVLLVLAYRAAAAPLQTVRRDGTRQTLG